MRHKKQTSAAALRENWQRWSDVVALFSKQRNPRLALQRREYRLLHNALVEGCQSRAMQSDAEERDYFLEMKNMVQPWISLETLDQAGHRILVRLTQRCRETQRTLAGKTLNLGRFRRGALIATAMLVVGALCWIDVSGSFGWATTVLRDAQDGMYRLAYLMPPMTWTKRFGMITVVVLIVAIQCIRTSTRRY